MDRIAAILAVAILLLPAGGVAAQQALGQNPKPTEPGTSPSSIPFGEGTLGLPANQERIDREAGKDFEKVAERRLGNAAFATLSKPDREILGRLWAVCPNTFLLVANLPKSLQSPILREILVHARTERAIASDFHPRPPDQLTFRPLPMLDLKNPRDTERDWLQYLYGILPDSIADDRLFGLARRKTLARALIPSELQPLLESMKLDELLEVVKYFAGSPSLAGAIAALPPALRPRAIPRVVSQLDVASADAVNSAYEAGARGEDAYTRAAEGEARRRAAELVLALGAMPQAKDEKDWPNLVAEMAKAVRWPVISLSRHPESRRIRCLVAHGASLKEKDIAVPRWEFLGIEKRTVAKDFGRLIGDSHPDEPVLFLGGDRDYSTHDLLPGRLTARSFDNSARFADLHVENFRQLAGRGLDPAHTILFNLIPESGETIRQLGLAGSEQRWQRARQRYDSWAKRKGLIRGDGSSRDQIFAALREGKLDTIVIVAHGERDGIFLQDGSKISVQDILNLEPLSSTHKPIIVLVSCETGRFDAGLRSMAQALLLRGRASAVLAHTERVPVLGPTIRFLDKILTVEAKPGGEAFKHLAGPWQLYVDRIDQGPSQRISQDRIAALVREALGSEAKPVRIIKSWSGGFAGACGAIFGSDGVDETPPHPDWA